MSPTNDDHFKGKVGPKGRRGPAPKGYEAVLYRVRPEQASALRSLAAGRAAPAMKRGDKGARPDASELVREAIDAWLAKNDK
jgi:hypothetical protein